MSLFSHALKAPVRWLLKPERLRHAFIFEIKQRHYPELDITVPLGAGVSCPVCFPEAWLSFAQIFFESEYEAALNRIALPSRWLDLGCHAGYFSLYVAWRRARQGRTGDFQALLIDGDERVATTIQRLKDINRFHDQILFRSGVIAARPGVHHFALADYMNSSLADLSARRGPVRAVPSIGPEEILRLLPPPYDLIKMDIEGGEYDFLTAYGEVLAQTNHLLLEWHSWHPGGGGRAQIEQLAGQAGFEIQAEVVAAQTVPRGDETGSCGVSLYRRRGVAPTSALRQQEPAVA
jgi:FkbM family methyltransferase